MKFFKKLFNALVATTLTATLTFAAACAPTDNGGGDEDSDPVALATPTLTISGNKLSWNEVSNADAYEINMNNSVEDTVTETGYTISHTAQGTYTYKVKATSSNPNYTDSEYSNTVTYTIKPNGETDDPKLFTVTFDSQGGSAVEPQTVAANSVVTEPANPVWAGKQFSKWTEDLQGNGEAYNFATPVTKSFTLYAQWSTLPASIKEVTSYNESLAVLFSETIPAQAKVEYQKVGESTWTEIDKELIRLTDDNTICRADIVGLAAGSYNVKITTSTNTEINVPEPVTVEAYDRSGYAHFNYNEGIGAYNDDGTLKSGTLVIYVTEENKNNVLDYAYVDGKKVDISQYMNAQSAAGGVTVGAQTGIGELLNNRRYAGNDRWNVGIAALCNAYGSVAIRIIGTVSAQVDESTINESDYTNDEELKKAYMASTINGLTTYNSTENGGSLGDNGRMARMVNAHDLTIEGIGDDASIYGWGVHFIASDVLHKQARSGKGFEVRNIKFENYPEDAVGMEGIQGDKWDENGSITSGDSSVTADLPSPVERCWIHNNTFLQGYAKKPAQSDKAEGDGSCDFKRGYYYTLSYNYFTDCHKTNLIGSSDKSLQFNITMHHNWWNNCGSRMPLVRNANLHFYNNYFSGDMSATPKPALSYVTSARANSYMFSENNYFDGAKQVVLLASGGQVKSYGDMFYATFGTYSGTIVSSRSQTIPNNCQFQKKGWDLSKFDTNADQFYYKDGQSDCLLDDAVTGRKKAMMYAGANGHGVTETAMNLYTPASAVSVPEEGLNIAIPTSKSDADVSGVMFRNISGVASGTVKFKGQGITFTLTAEAQLTVTTTTTGDSAPELIDSNGYVYAHKFEGTLTIVLQPGTYVIASGQKEKESVISVLKFDDTSASSAARVQAATDAINALADANVELTDAYEALINTARSAYNALTPAEKAAFDATLYAKLVKATEEFGKLQVAEFERLVALIGTVTKDSYNTINAAQQAYDKLTSELQLQAAEAKATLDAAWAAYDTFAVQNVIDLITAFAAKVNASSVNESTTRATIEALINESNTILAAYEALSDEAEEGASQQAQVTNYGSLLSAISKLENINKLFLFQDELEYFEGLTVTLADASKVASLKAAYEALSETQKSLVTTEQKALYDSVLAAYDAIASQMIESDFSGEKGAASNSFFTVSNNNATNSTFHINGLGGKDFTRGLKIESKTQVTFTTTTKMTLTLYVDAAKKIYIDGAEVSAAQNADSDYVVVITLDAGTHTLTKRDSMNLWYVTLTPAA